jgi:SAM-dependent methyltransferase
MLKTGPNFFDDEVVFASYMQRRQGLDTPNDTLEKPVLMDIIHPITDKRILDLGCGDAAIGLELLQQGAASYVGIEGSEKMANVARRTLANTCGQVILQRIEDGMYPHAAFDLVISRLALHYVADLAPIFTKVYNAIAPSGQFVFSVEHPVITSFDAGWTAGTPRQDWIVDNYFTTGLRVTNWLGATVQKYHRTVEDYFHLLQENRFIITDLREAHPQHEYFQDLETYERRKRIPLFLILAARKPG